MEAGKDDPYEILGIQTTSSKDEVKKAYRKLCLKFHPDKAKSEEERQEFTRKMYKLNHAKEVLMDDEKLKEWQRECQMQQEEEADDEPEKGYWNEEQRDDRENDDEEDDDEKDDDEDDVPEPNKDNRHRESAEPPKYRDMRNLGTPYRVPVNTGQDINATIRKNFMFRYDGKDGHDACNGVSGRSGKSPGESGSNGTNAGPAGHGLPAQDIKINVEVMKDHGTNHFVVNVLPFVMTDKFIPLSDPNGHIPLKLLGKIDWSARGGKGGRGGCGGAGGRGANGYRGRDATMHSVGTDGGPGGNGGDGGLGSNGGNGGRGGNVEILVDRDDLYLLMLIEGTLNNVGNRVDGGVGGKKGLHGVGGVPGKGGSGGSPYHYQVVVRSEFYTQDTYGNRHYPTTTQTRMIPGGKNGPSGKVGSCPIFLGLITLSNGSRGQNGTFRIRVTDDGEMERYYDSRFDLQFKSAQYLHLSSLTHDVDCFEFGETFLVKQCTVQNVGQMEMPKQRVEVRATQCNNCYNTRCSGRIYLDEDTCLNPQVSGQTTEGCLEFEASVPTNFQSTDFDPVTELTSIRYRAFQLGHENFVLGADRDSDFKEEYLEFCPSYRADKFVLSFPIENLDGIRGVRALGPEETTWLTFNLQSLTHNSLGTLSATGRDLFVQFYYGDDKKYDIPMDQVEIRNEHGSVVSIDPKTSPNNTNRNKKGHRHHIPILGGGKSTTIRLSLKLLQKDVPTAAKVSLQADVYVQPIPKLHPDGTKVASTKNMLVQRRIFSVSCQPKFNTNLETDIILVCTTESSKEQVASWEKIARQLRLSCKVYSLARYGHMDSDSFVDGSVRLRDAFANSLIIILNDKYHVNPNSETERNVTESPSSLLRSYYDFAPTTRFLIVGGDQSSVRHLSYYSSATGNKSSINVANKGSMDDHPENDQGGKPINTQNCKGLFAVLKADLLRERTYGFDGTRGEKQIITVPIKSSFIFCFKQAPNLEQVKKRMEHKAQKVSNRLHKQDGLRRYYVEWISCTDNDGQPEKVKNGSKNKPLWKIGELQIRSGPPRFESDVTHVVESPDGTDGSSSSSSSSRVIAVGDSDKVAMMNTTLKSISMEKTINVFAKAVRSVAADVRPSDESKTEASINNLCESLSSPSIGRTASDSCICRVAMDVLIEHFVMDVSNYYDGRLKVVQVEKGRSATVESLLSSSSLRSLIDDAKNDHHLETTLKPHLSFLFAGLQCAASSKDLKPWWKPLSRKYKASKDMKESLGLLRTQWDGMVDDDMMKEQKRSIQKSVDRFIRSDRKKWMVAIRGRWRAGLCHVLSPLNSERYCITAGDGSTINDEKDNSKSSIQLVRRSFGFDDDRTNTKIRKSNKAEIMDPAFSGLLKATEQARFATLDAIREQVESDDKHFRF